MKKILVLLIAMAGTVHAAPKVYQYYPSYGTATPGPGPSGATNKGDFSGISVTTPISQSMLSLYTPTITPTFTLTATHTVTATNTNTPTHTVTVTHTNTPTHTVTATYTNDAWRQTVTPINGTVVANSTQIAALQWTQTAVVAAQATNWVKRSGDSIVPSNPANVGLTIKQGFSAAASLLPNQVDNLCLWLEADKQTHLTTDGQSVTYLIDASSNAISFRTATTGYATYETDVSSLLNGNPVMRFNGNIALTQTVVLNTILDAETFTHFYVWKPKSPAGANHNYMTSINVSGNYCQWIIPYGGNTKLYNRWGATDQNVDAPSGFMGNWHLTMFRRGVTTDYMEIFVDNASQAAASIAGAQTNSGAANIFIYNYQAANDTGMYGDNALVLWYKSAVSGADLSGLLTWIYGKYGVGQQQAGTAQTADLLQFQNTTGAVIGGFTKDADYKTNTNTAGAALIGNGTAYVPVTSPGLVIQSVYGLVTPVAAPYATPGGWTLAASKVVTCGVPYGMGVTELGSTFYGFWSVDVLDYAGNYVLQPSIQSTPVGWASPMTDSDHGAGTSREDTTTRLFNWVVTPGIPVTLGLLTNGTAPYTIKNATVMGSEIK